MFSLIIFRLFRRAALDFILYRLMIQLYSQSHHSTGDRYENIF